MKLAILGTRGIPNHYGGFEQFADYFAVYMADRGHEVYVYNSHTHPYQEKIYKGAHILHKYDPENKMGTAGQFIYDLNCILDCRKRKFDAILQLGYTSSSIWNFLFPSSPVILTNMDGLEWKRSKFSRPVQRFLKYAEKLAIKHSDVLIADSVGIQQHIQKTYGKASHFIAYGAEIFEEPNSGVLKEYHIRKEAYSMIIARLEPENNIETIIQGYIKSETTEPLLVVGNHHTDYGEYLKSQYRDDRIRFMGGIYDINKLNNLRYFSRLYFHGHSVGGTNPSLLEAMASGALIVANDNIFNRAILEEKAFYFKHASAITRYVNEISKPGYLRYVEENIEKINAQFNWQLINEKYEALILKSINA